MLSNCTWAGSWNWFPWGGFANESGENLFPHQFPHSNRLFRHLTACGIERYIDLLLLDNRLSTQPHGIASPAPSSHR